MADLIDLKRTKAEKKEAIKCPTIGSTSDYPYGLELRLGSDELEKLGMKELPAVGEEYTLTAHCVVTDVSQHSDQSGDDRRNVTVQVQKMAPLEAATNDEPKRSVRDDVNDSVKAYDEKSKK